MSLEKDFQRKIRAHIEDYVQQDVTRARHTLSRIKLLSYIQARDKILARKKKAILEKVIDTVCNQLERTSMLNEENQIEIKDDSDQHQHVSSSHIYTNSLMIRMIRMTRPTTSVKCKSNLSHHRRSSLQPTRCINAEAELWHARRSQKEQSVPSLPV